MNLSDVYVFKKVASTLSFTKAARNIGVSRSAISKQVSRLEKNLGVVLINRTTRSVNLTEAGRIFDTQTARIDTTIERAAEMVRNTNQNPQGTVAFTLPSALCAELMPALTTQFHQRWPELALNINVADHPQDLIDNNLDLAIRISSKLKDSSLISRRLASTRRVLAASPRYLQEHGTPQKPIDIKDHQCLGIGSAVNSGATWQFLEAGEIVDVPVSFVLSTNNDLAVILAARFNAGIIYVPEICIAGELARNQLQLIPGCTNPEPLGVYALYPHRNVAAHVKIVVDFIEDLLPSLLPSVLPSLLPSVANLDRCVPLADRAAKAAGATKKPALLRDNIKIA